MKKNFVNASELTNVVVDLYTYIKDIKIGNCIWHNEFLETKTPCICFKRQSTPVEKLNANIKGSYNAELPFIVYYRDEVKDTKQSLEIAEPLNKLTEIFRDETDKGFPKLIIHDDSIIPISLEMTATPADASGIENNKATFMATYKFTYRKKGRFE